MAIIGSEHGTPSPAVLRLKCESLPRFGGKRADMSLRALAGKSRRDFRQ